MDTYGRDFYSGRNAQTVNAATTILAIVLARIPPINSAIDVGCGVGTWLSVLRAMHVADVRGIDGDWVDPALLEIPSECFTRQDLATSTIAAGRRYDLALSLEVAEHLPASCAVGLVRALTDLSDFVLFSAAVPHQGGRHHCNEQWQSYWAGLFADDGYDLHDVVRPGIWEDDRIPYWYRQNILLYVRRGAPGYAAAAASVTLPVDLVHPQLYLRRLGALRRFRHGLRALLSKPPANKELGDH